MIALEELIKLPASEREQIIEALEQSLEDERALPHETPEFWAEIERRSEYMRGNPSSASSWEDVKKRIFSKRG